MRNKFFENALNKGFWDKQVDINTGEVVPALVEETIPQALALIHSEVSEALEAFREYEMVEETEGNGKPIGFPSELADIVIRVYDLAGALGINLDACIERKHAYNLTRPHKHGGRRI